MKNLFKKIISCIMAVSMVPLFKIPVEAKIIEPEVVKTEKWTTSYFIDDDMETLYPYVQCEANIYNDGVIEVSYGNTYEWTGFATVSHFVTLISTEPYSTNSMEYAFKTGNTYTNDAGGTFKTSYNFDNIDLSFYPKEYEYTYGTRNNSWGNCDQDVIGSYNMTIEHFDIILLTSNYYYTSFNNDYIRHDSYRGSLPYLSVDKKVFITFTPMVDPTSTYHFRLYGHDITITPELLSSNVIATPEPSEQEKRIAELEEQNRLLLEQNNKLIDEKQEFENKISDLESKLASIPKPGDLNCDNVIDILDAIILRRYLAGTIEELPYIPNNS